MATKDIEEIIAAKPDCVLYMPDRTEPDNICRLLESGINVVATRMDLHNPDTLDPDVRSRIEEACQKGGTSLYSSGSSPGFITEVLPIGLLSIQRHLDRLTIDEFADMSSRNSPEMIFDLLGFGRDPSSYDPAGFTQHGAMSFGPSLRQLASAVGMPLDDVTATGYVAAANHDTTIAAGQIKAGTIAAQRMEVSGLHKGNPLLVFRANWYLTTDIDPAWDLRESGWRVLVEGDAPLDVSISFPVPEERWAATSPGLTAHRPVNSVPYVCEAPPGIRMTVDLPQILPTFA
jgi:4-hydroxy-tetrahydrodipicolinate reductase